MPPLLPSIEGLSRLLQLWREGTSSCVSLCSLYAQMTQSGMVVHAFIGNFLVSVLTEAGKLIHAGQIFNKLVYPDERAWNSIITAYARSGDLPTAVALFQKMDDVSIKPRRYTVVALFRACTIVKDIEIGSTLHTKLAEKGIVENDVFIATILVDMYVKCGFLSMAKEVFDSISDHDVVLWTALIGGCVEHGHNEEALQLITEMQNKGVSPDAFTIVSSLKACGNLDAVKLGQTIHSDIVSKGLETELVIGNSLVDMYARCGFLTTAKYVFDKLLFKDIISWNSLLSGYVEHGDDIKVLECLERMHLERIPWDAITAVCSLKACSNLRYALNIQDIHCWVYKVGLERDVVISNTLIHACAQCCLFEEATNVLRTLPVRDVVSWTALLDGYVGRLSGDEALNCFQEMQDDQIPLNAISLLCSLKACTIVGDTLKVYSLHAEIVRRGLESDSLLGNTLVDMYAKCNQILTAEYIFNKLPVHDAVSWNALISGYVERGYWNEVYECLEEMEREGISSNTTVTVVYSLIASGSSQCVGKGQDTHLSIVKTGMDNELFVRNTLMDMYAKCGLMQEALAIFEKLPFEDSVAWGTLLSGYTECANDEKIIEFLKQMQNNCIPHNEVSSICVLKSCIWTCDMILGKKMHIEILKRGLENCFVVASSLIDMYAKCGLLVDAEDLFNRLIEIDEVLWTTLISGFITHGYREQALSCIEKLQNDIAVLNGDTYICILKTCGELGAQIKGLETHNVVTKMGFEQQIHIGSALVHMYTKCACIEEAKYVFYGIPQEDMMSWTALLAHYIEHGLLADALIMFEKMQHHDVMMNPNEYVYGLKACAISKDVAKGMRVHSEIVKKGWDGDTLIANTLIDMYARSGQLMTAYEVFAKLSTRDVVSWNSLLTACTDHGHLEEALASFEQLHVDDTCPDATTLFCAVKACGSLGAITKGQEVHDEVVRLGLETQPNLEVILVDMYAKCALLQEAEAIFHDGSSKNVVSWNALMTGYTLLGLSGDVFNILSKMLDLNICPSPLTVLNALNVCSHDGLVNEAHLYFEVLLNEYRFIPLLEHYTCIIDLHGRAGQLDRAAVMIREMPLHPDVVLWQTMLAACKKWNNVEHGRHAFDHTVGMDKNIVASYVSMSNIYATAAVQKQHNIADRSMFADSVSVY